MLDIHPPYLNSACPWATTLEELQALYDSPYTGAVTTRTSQLGGFPHNDSVHQHLFFSLDNADKDGGSTKSKNSSLNTYGYSPHPLQYYLDCIQEISNRLNASPSAPKKPFIVSVTGSDGDISSCCKRIHNLRQHVIMPLWVEINLSCPNIAGKPPPAYNAVSFKEYLESTTGLVEMAAQDHQTPMPVGFKLPPYTYLGQFQAIVDVIAKSQMPVAFLTSCNTLGSSLVMKLDGTPALSSEAGTGIGGMAGAALHPIALGNVATLRQLLDTNDGTRDIFLIGVGGVEDHYGATRMLSAGANAVACATAFGRQGVGVFAKIARQYLEPSV